MGVSLYHGKFGYDKWKGDFVDDLPHGKGVMTDTNGNTKDFFFVAGEPMPGEGHAQRE